MLKTHFIVRIGFCTTLCVLSIACTFFLIDGTFFPEFHSGLIWNQTVFANVNREREKERETGTFTSFRENQSASIDRQVERERERMCVCYF